VGEVRPNSSVVLGCPNIFHRRHTLQVAANTRGGGRRSSLDDVIESALSMARIMYNTDQETLLQAIEDARRILEEYNAPRPRDATYTLHRLIGVFDRPELLHAVERMKTRRTLRLVE